MRIETFNVASLRISELTGVTYICLPVYSIWRLYVLVSYRNSAHVGCRSV